MKRARSYSLDFKPTNLYMNNYTLKDWWHLLAPFQLNFEEFVINEELSKFLQRCSGTL